MNEQTRAQLEKLQEEMCERRYDACMSMGDIDVFREEIDVRVRLSYVHGQSTAYREIHDLINKLLDYD